MNILINCSQVLLTTRNVLIANLAVTDLLLSTTAIPLTLLDVIYKYWPLGEDMVRMNNVLLTHVSHCRAGCARLSDVFSAPQSSSPAPASVSLLWTDTGKSLREG